jgi:hypothetical protein
LIAHPHDGQATNLTSLPCAEAHHSGDNVMIVGAIILTVVTHIMNDGRVITQETVQSSMEECYRVAEIVNKANGAEKYKFFASCRDGQQGRLVKAE